MGRDIRYRSSFGGRILDMLFHEAPLKGAFVLEVEPHNDERGIFARVFCEEEFAVRGLNTVYRQCSVSWNKNKGTLRGMHFQVEPGEEVKLVRCTSGSIYDVIVDLRPNSPTKGRWFGVELSQDNRRSLYIPNGFAHGFITLQDEVEVYYMISVPYRPDLARGIRWDDPGLAIEWPFSPKIISQRDRTYPAFGGLFEERVT